MFSKSSVASSAGLKGGLEEAIFNRRPEQALLPTQAYFFERDAVVDRIKLLQACLPYG